VNAIEIVESPDSSFSDGNNVILDTIIDFSSFSPYSVSATTRE